MTAFDDLLSGISQGRASPLMGDSDAVRALLSRVYDERCHSARHHRDAYQLRVNLQKKDDAASYAGWITAENPTSGPYQGTSLVWFPGAEGSVAVLVVGTDGFGADAHILGRPGHRRRLSPCRRLEHVARDRHRHESVRARHLRRDPGADPRRTASASPISSTSSSTSTALR